MKTKLLLFLNFICLGLFAQTTHQLSWANDGSCANQQITIDAGDTVVWTWAGGYHNLRSLTGGAESFDSGFSSQFGFTFEKIFTVVGQTSYVCDPHAQNMYGTVTVNPASQNFNPGDIVVTEFMNDSAAVSDTVGEWLEIYNSTGADIDLNGWTLKDDGSNSHTFSTSVIVPSGVFFVMGRGPADSSQNGGLNLDHSYGNGVFTLGNSDDEIIILDPSLNEIDRVEYGSANGFPDGGPGLSISLDPTLLNDDNNVGSNWCLSTSVYGDGDSGTPGLANDVCSPVCEASLGSQDVACDATTSGVDTYTVTLNYSGAGTSDFVVTATSGTVGGDDPSTTANGSITVSGIAEGTDITITMDDTATGGLCALTREVTSPVCQPTGSVDLELQGILDLSLSSSDGKAIHVIAIDDIADLSVYGIGVANNGGGTDGEEYSFPVMSILSGDHILVVRSEAAMQAYFESCYGDFNYVLLGNSAISQNGDDAIELFKNGSVVETFGDISVDGTGQTWEYMDSWAYKIEGEWTYGAVNCTDGSSTSSTSDCPYPFCSGLSTSDLIHDEISVYPNPVDDGFVAIKSQILGEVNVKLFDIMGRCVLSKQINSETLDVRALGSGVYLLRVSISNQTSTTKLIIK